MKDLLANAGYAECEVHHLFPDYKMTRAVLSDEFLLNKPEVCADIQTSFSFEDYSGKKLCCFLKSWLQQVWQNQGYFMNFQILTCLLLLIQQILQLKTNCYLNLITLLNWVFCTVTKEKMKLQPIL